MTDADGKTKKWPTGHFFALDLRNHHTSLLTTADTGPWRKREHDMRAIKRCELDALRGGEPKGRKVLLAWDRAGIDFNFWEKAKGTAGLYFLSMEKKNMDFMKCGDMPFDRSDPRNAGVTSDEMGGPGSSGRMFSRSGSTIASAPRSSGPRHSPIPMPPRCPPTSSPGTRCRQSP